ncbi:GGDEF domain-containing protein, partial [Vibrio sp. 1569]
SSTDAQTAEREAERIQEAMYFLDYQHEFSSVANRVTVSQGVFVFQPTGKENQADLYATADRALYTSKSLGRNTYTMVNAS